MVSKTSVSIDNHGSGYQEWLGVSMYTANFLSQIKLPYLSTKNLWIKLGTPVKRAVFNITVHQIS